MYNVFLRIGLFPLTFVNARLNKTVFYNLRNNTIIKQTTPITEINNDRYTKIRRKLWVKTHQRNESHEAPPVLVARRW